MKKVYEDPKNSIDIMERMNNLRLAFRYIFKEIDGIEKDFFSLVGERYGSLKVIAPHGYRRLTDIGEEYIPAWLCECDCGEQITVEHKNLITNDQSTAVRDCGGETHVSQ